MIIKNNLDIPEYLNEEFFKKTIQNALNTTNIKIEGLNFSMGSAAGDNYSSNIYRAIVSYREKDDQSKVLPLIIKSIPKGEYRGAAEQLNMHGKEVIVFLEVMPKLESILVGTKLAPKCYYTADEPLKTIVFEDLRDSSYTLADREIGLNEAQCKLVLEKLGKFHAASMYWAEKEPQMMLSFNYGFFIPEVMDSPITQSFFVDSLKMTISLVENWPGYEKYAAKMRIIYKNVADRILAISQPTDGELKVLNHGDLWVNNFMFKYENDNSENPLDVLFFDYQGTFYTSPGMDINYFLSTSVQFDILEKRRDFMVEEYYYKSLRTTLEKIGFEQIPSFENIKMEIRRKEFYGLISAVAILPVICMDRKDSADNSLESFIDKETADKKRLLACQSKRFEKVMKYMLKRADDLGVLA